MSPTRHLLDIESMDNSSLDWLLCRGCTIGDYPGSGLGGERVANLFYEPSTRTRVSFQVAAERLGAGVVNIEADRASVTKGESLLDTALTLHAMGIDYLVLRHPDSGAVEELARFVPPGLHLLNAGDGIHAHPSQALLDAMTLKQCGVVWEEATLAIIGDIRHSRVAHSDIALFSRLGVNNLRIAGPPALLPEEPIPGVTVCDSLEQAVAGADAVIMLRLQKERMARAGWPSDEEYHEKWGLKPHHLKQAGAECRVLHPGPMNRNVEIASSVADGPRSLILQQVRNGVLMRMAILEWLARGPREKEKHDE